MMGSMVAWFSRDSMFQEKNDNTLKPWTPHVLHQTLARSLTFANFHLPSSSWKKHHDQILLPPKLLAAAHISWKVHWNLDFIDTILFSDQDRPSSFWRSDCVKITIPLLFLSPSSFPLSPRGTDWWRDRGESQDKDKNLYIRGENNCRFIEKASKSGSFKKLIQLGSYPCSFNYKNIVFI